MNKAAMIASQRAALALLVCSSLSSASAVAVSEKEWRFRVYLDDQEIGFHSFTLAQRGQVEEVTSRAKFDVTFLRIPLFSYRHENVELWRNGCLEAIESHTKQNSEEFRVKGAVDGPVFRVSTHETEEVLPACISTFAYWDKSFLEHDRLLNAQTGEYVQVATSYQGESVLDSPKSRADAHRYRVETSDADIVVWYSEDDQWLSLETVTDGGRLLRYVSE